MKAVIKIVDPLEVDVSLTVTMPLSEWRALACQIHREDGDRYPTWKFLQMVNEAVDHAYRSYTVEAEKE